MCKITNNLQYFGQTVVEVWVQQELQRLTERGQHVGSLPLQGAAEPEDRLREETQTWRLREQMEDLHQHALPPMCREERAQEHGDKFISVQRSPQRRCPLIPSLFSYDNAASCRSRLQEARAPDTNVCSSLRRWSPSSLWRLW